VTTNIIDELRQDLRFVALPQCQTSGERLLYDTFIGEKGL